MTQHEFWDRAFAAEGLDGPAIRRAAMQRGAALAARRTESKLPVPVRRPLTALAAAAAVCLFAVGAAAAGGLLVTPPEAAAILTHTDISAFQNEENYPELVSIYSSPDVITVNEVQADAGYTVTLLAIANEAAAEDAAAGEDVAHTHILYTVAHTDGSPMTEQEWQREISEEPLMQGSGISWSMMNGSVTTFRVKDGVLYADVRVADLYPFADRELYFAVMQRWGFAGTLGYHADADGRISTAADYENLNLLFTLPIGAEHADADQAARVQQSWQYTPTPEEQAALDAAVAQAKASAAQDAAAAAQQAGQSLPEPGSAQDTVANNPGTLTSIKADMGAWAGYTRAELRAAGEVLFTKVCELTLLPGQSGPCYYYESRYNSRIFDRRDLRGAPWAVVGLGFEGGAVEEATILNDNGDGTVTVEILALPPLAE